MSFECRYFDSNTVKRKHQSLCLKGLSYHFHYSSLLFIILSTLQFASLFPAMACLNGGTCDFSAGDDVETGDEFPFERVFPVYARGTLNPVADPVLLDFSNSDYDPIWDSIREEAKLEVFSFCSIIIFLLMKKHILFFLGYFHIYNFNSSMTETLISLISKLQFYSRL